ncbi:sensor histidine kinase [Dactylosporangium sp. CA-139066]|uniref:sensor histidine kinase n=1 Tax=Dactylosporangium sp. CA-139066 TaxID=3239930 RepID=UPI003D8EDC24
MLAALTAPLPVTGVTVGIFGSRFARGWTHGPSAPLALRILAYAGEALAVIVWVAAALWMVHALTSRPLSGVARRCARRWLGLDLAVEYAPVAPVTRMSTGFWWDGKEYHGSQREARRRTRMNARFHDPQVSWDGLWALAAGVTVCPVALLPWLGIAGGAVLAATPGLAWYGAAAVVAGLAAAPFAWRVLGPVARRLLGPGQRRRVAELEAIRADMTQTQAAELERIERGLHDGAQSRLVALGLSMQAAERLLESDPATAREILAEARAASVAALAELRSLVRGINPPVLAERGLVEAVRALALDAAVEVDVRSTVAGRAERPVEAAVYFAVAELLTNVAKHARARRAAVDLAHAGGTLTAARPRRRRGPPPWTRP